MKLDPPTLRIINILVTGGVSTAYIVGKSLSVNYVSRNLDLKENRKAQSVPPNLQSLIDEVTEDMKFDLKKYQIKPFMSKGSDLQHFSAPFYNDIYIGIPEYYIFDKDEKSQFTVLVDEKELPQTAPEFTPLKQAMCLTTEAKKFGIARGLYESQQSIVGPSFFMPMCIMLNCSWISYVLQRYEKFSKKPIHISNHCMVFLIGVWMYVVLYDIANIFKETVSDFKASAIGKFYAQGGIEYYQKMIKRNKIFKKLNKAAPYTEEGDIKTSFIRTEHMPLENRIAYLQDLRKGTTKKSVWSYILF